MKIYLKPTTDMLYISVEQMIATSGPVSPTSGNNDLSKATETTETSGNLTRRKDIWTDPDEEEEEDFR